MSKSSKRQTDDGLALTSLSSSSSSARDRRDSFEDDMDDNDATHRDAYGAADQHESSDLNDDGGVTHVLSGAPSAMDDDDDEEDGRPMNPGDIQVHDHYRPPASFFDIVCRQCDFFGYARERWASILFFTSLAIFAAVVIALAVDFLRYDSKTEGEIRLTGYGSAKHVVLIGLDGLGAYYVGKSAHPVSKKALDRMHVEGTWTLDMLSQVPPDGVSNWAAVLTGSTASFSGIDSSLWTPNTTWFQADPVQATRYGILTPCLACRSVYQRASTDIASKTDNWKNPLTDADKAAVTASVQAYCATLVGQGREFTGVCNALVTPLINSLATKKGDDAIGFCRSIEVPDETGQRSRKLPLCTSYLPPITQGLYPSIYSRIKGLNSTFKTLLYTDDNSVLRGLEGIDNVDHLGFYTNGTDMVTAFRDLILTPNYGVPQFSFFHFDDVDAAAHQYGFDTEQYRDAITRVDKYVELIQDAVHEAGKLEDTVFIVIGEHGGEPQEKTHTRQTVKTHRVPMWITGPAVVQAEEKREREGNGGIHSLVRTIDIMPTVLYALGVPIPDSPARKVNMRDIAYEGRIIYELTGFETVYGNINKLNTLHSPDHKGKFVVLNINGLSMDGILSHMPNIKSNLLDQGCYSSSARLSVPCTAHTNMPQIHLSMSTAESSICDGDLPAGGECRWSSWPMPPTSWFYNLISADMYIPSAWRFWLEKSNFEVVMGMFVRDEFELAFLDPENKYPRGDKVERSARNTDAEVISDATAFLQKTAKARKADVTYLSLNDCEAIGHNKGWKSSEYTTCLSNTDNNLQVFFNAVSQMYTPSDNPYFFLTSAHGAAPHDDLAGSCQVPFALRGPGFPANHQLSDTAMPVRLIDIAPTIARFLGIPIQRFWQGAAMDPERLP